MPKASRAALSIQGRECFMTVEARVGRGDGGFEQIATKQGGRMDLLLVDCEAVLDR